MGSMASSGLYTKDLKTMLCWARDTVPCLQKDSVW